MIEVGQKVKFDPYKGINVPNLNVSVTLTGTVVAVYEDHRWFSVEYIDEEKKKRRASFKFDDIGDIKRLFGNTVSLRSGKLTNSEFLAACMYEARRRMREAG